LAAITVVLTPLTTGAGQWPEGEDGPSPVLHAHHRTQRHDNVLRG
jgi:hypothetical protein